jgi:hypothetical protein
MSTTVVTVLIVLGLVMLAGFLSWAGRMAGRAAKLKRDAIALKAAAQAEIQRLQRAL